MCETALIHCRNCVLTASDNNSSFLFTVILSIINLNFEICLKTLYFVIKQNMAIFKVYKELKL